MYIIFDVSGTPTRKAVPAVVQTRTRMGGPYIDPADSDAMHATRI